MSKQEIFLVISLVALNLIVNLATSSRYPMVGDDEVMLADAGVNLYLGNGFTSTAWNYQSRDEFWAGNTPLYSVLVAGWLWLFGFSLESVRSIGYVLMATGTLALWWSMIRHRLIVSGWVRVLLVVVVLMDSECVFMYRSARYDSVAFLLVTLTFLAASIGRPAVRYCCLGGIAFFFPLTMVALSVYATVLGALLIVFGGRTYLKEVISIFIGFVAGAALLYGIYQSQGVWDSFTRSAAALRNAGREFPKDPGLALLLLTCMLLVIRDYWCGERNWRTPFGFGLAAGVLFGGIMYILGRFPTYNAWMAVIPIAVGLLSRPDLGAWSDRTTGIVVGTLLLLVCISGFPLIIGAAVLFWKERDYARVQELVDRNVGATDWVLCSSQAYYAAKPRAGAVFTQTYHLIPDAPDFSPDEKERINVLILTPASVNPITLRLGGVWTSNGDKLTPPETAFLVPGNRFRKQFTWYYNLVVLKRKPN